MCFFTLSTTPGILLDAHLSRVSAIDWVRGGFRRSLIRPAAKTAAVITAAAAVAYFGLLLKTWNLSVSGDISDVLTKKASEDYTSRWPILRT